MTLLDAITSPVVIVAAVYAFRDVAVINRPKPRRKPTSR